MSYGLQVFNASGGKRLDENSFVHNIIAYGNAQLSGPYPYTATINITGIQPNNSEWLVCWDMGYADIDCTVYNGYIVIQASYLTTVRYSVYRR